MGVRWYTVLINWFIERVGSPANDMHSEKARPVKPAACIRVMGLAPVYPVQVDTSEWGSAMHVLLLALAA